MSRKKRRKIKKRLSNRSIYFRTKQLEIKLIGGVLSGLTRRS